MKSLKQIKYSLIKSTVFIITTILTLCFTAPAICFADEESGKIDLNTVIAYKIPELDVEVKVPSDLATFTRTVTSNNSYLSLIGASSAEDLRNNMLVNHIYLEAIPKDNITYEIILTGYDANSEAKAYSEMSTEELNSRFKEYVASCDNISNNTVTEKVDSSSIETINGIPYFVTNITSKANNGIVVLLKRYHTCIQGKNISFTLQTNQEKITDDMNEVFDSIVKNAEYKDIKGSIFDNPVFMEILSSFITVLVPVAVLGLIFYMVLRANKKKK